MYIKRNIHLQEKETFLSVVEAADTEVTIITAMWSWNSQTWWAYLAS